MELYARNKRRLGDLLVDEKIITENQLSSALQEQKDSGNKIGEILVDLGFTTEQQIAFALHKQLGFDYVSLTSIQFNEEVLTLMNDSLLRKYQVFPYEFSKENANVLRVAMANPLDILAIDDLSIITNLQIEPVIATAREIALSIDKYYGNKEAMAVAQKYADEEINQYVTDKEDDLSRQDIENSPIVHLVNSIIEQAVRQRASDIHIEALMSNVRVRYRIDGSLKEIMKFDISMLAVIVARIKIMAGIDISEKRKPQDGRFSKIVNRQEYDIRVSILPTIYGEKIVMRLASKSGFRRDKKELGLSGGELKMFDKIMLNPHGIILVTGPTGSGKSTTLYTTISEVNRENVNIISVEDPVEANIDGINQVSVNEKVGLTFAAALRSILRQDPDIIMIGEIRDSETAEIAIKASITGHLVVSTLHTNSAVSTITRLEDMGIEPYLIADSVVGVIAQRLVRKLCNNCKAEKIADEGEKQLLKVDINKTIKIFEPRGCPQCNDTGYYGRIGVFEIMNISSKLKTIISSKQSADAIEQCALKEGMNTLRVSAVNKVLEGITSISEIKHIIYEK